MALRVAGGRGEYFPGKPRQEVCRLPGADLGNEGGTVFRARRHLRPGRKTGSREGPQR